jgi:hypothetical protein
VTGSFRSAALAAALLAGAAPGEDIAPAGQQMERAVAQLNGVFSPRGFFNITVRLYELPGVEAAKFDLKKSRITLDFKPGATATVEQIQEVMIGAGYKPGPVEIRMLNANEAARTGPGWVKIKHPTSKNPVIRWVQLNF